MHAEQRAEVELFFAVNVVPGHQVPQHGPVLVLGVALVVAIERKERRPGFPPLVAVGHQHVEGTEELELFFAGAVVPFAEQRPDMREVGRGGEGIGQALLLLRPVEQVEKLRALLGDPAILPFQLFQHGPQVPGLVHALLDGVRVKRSPAVDHLFVPMALDEKRPEVTRLAVAVGFGAFGVAEEGPDIGLVEEPRVSLDGVKRNETKLPRGRRALGCILHRWDRVVPAQRPEKKGMVGTRRRIAAATVKRP